MLPYIKSFKMHCPRLSASCWFTHTLSHIPFVQHEQLKGSEVTRASSWEPIKPGTVCVRVKTKTHAEKKQLNHLHWNKLACSIHGCGSLCIADAAWTCMHEESIHHETTSQIMFSHMPITLYEVVKKHNHKLSPFGYDLSWAARYFPVVCNVWNSCAVNIHCSTNPDCNIHGGYCMHVFTKQGVGLCYYTVSKCILILLAARVCSLYVAIWKVVMIANPAD